MGSFFTVLDKLVMLFLLIVVGYAARKSNIIDDGFNKNISAFLTKVTLPALFIMSLQVSFTDELLKKGSMVFLLSIVIHILCMIIGFIAVKLLHIKKSLYGIWIFSCMFSNHGYMGFPVIAGIFGNEALFYCSFANLAFNVLAYTLGVVIISRYGSTSEVKLPINKILLSPTNIAMAIGFILFACKITLPNAVGNSLSMLGSMTSPLGMLYIGASLTKSSFKEMFDGWEVYAITFIRLIIIPTISFFVLKPFISDSMILGVMVLGHAMPVGAYCAIFAGEYGGDVFTASKYIFVSTLLCMLTIPIIAVLVV